MEAFQWEQVEKQNVRPAAPFTRKPDTRPEHKLPVSAHPPMAAFVARPTEPYATACPYLMPLAAKPNETLYF